MAGVLRDVEAQRAPRVICQSSGPGKRQGLFWQWPAPSITARMSNGVRRLNPRERRRGCR